MVSHYVIHQILRRNHIDEHAAGLIDAAEGMSEKNSVLAGVYDALGTGIHGSHTPESGAHYLTLICRPIASSPSKAQPIE